jgi:hypothetical protein
MKNRSKHEVASIETMEEELARKRAEYEQAEKELNEMKANQPQGDYVNGIFRTWEELERRKRVKEEQDEAARKALEPKEPEKPFIPNRYIVLKEKTELAEMMLHKYILSEQKTFIDPRHKRIFDVYQNELANRRLLNLDEFIEVLKNKDMIELAGGMDFITDIFQCLPK